MTVSSFPQYLLSIDGRRKFYPLREAGIHFDSGWARVEVVGLVLNEDLTVRDITEVEARRISDIAEEYSSSK